MDRELIAHIAFSIQDETLSRQRAETIVRAVLASLRAGDNLGHGLVVRAPLESSALERQTAAFPVSAAENASPVAARSQLRTNERQALPVPEAMAPSSAFHA